VQAFSAKTCASAKAKATRGLRPKEAEQIRTCVNELRGEKHPWDNKKSTTP